MRIVPSKVLIIVILLPLYLSLVGADFVLIPNKAERLLRIDPTTKITVRASALRSYMCEAYSDSANSTLTFSSTFFGAGNLSPQMPNGELGRVRFCPGVNSSETFVIDFENVDPMGEDVNVSCRDTTLFGSFNTFINNFSFLELENRSSDMVEVIIRVVDSFGNLRTDTARLIAANQRLDFDLHSRVGADSIGQIQVRSDAPAGAIAGRVAAYKGTLDDFELSGYIPLVSLP